MRHSNHYLFDIASHIQYRVKAIFTFYFMVFGQYIYTNTYIKNQGVQKWLTNQSSRRANHICVS